MALHLQDREAEVKTVLTLPFPPSTNNLFINTRRGRIRSSKYHEWATEAGWELKRQRPAKRIGPVVLFYQFQDGKDKRKRDIGNLEKAITDLLVEHQVIEADDNTIVREINLCWADTVKGVRAIIFSVPSDYRSPNYLSFHRVPETLQDSAETV